MHTDFPPVARQLRAGDLVEVQSEAEILATLDIDGTLDGLPEMLVSCCRGSTVDYRRHELPPWLLVCGGHAIPALHGRRPKTPLRLELEAEPRLVRKGDVDA